MAWNSLLARDLSIHWKTVVRLLTLSASTVGMQKKLHFHNTRAYLLLAMFCHYYV